MSETGFAEPSVDGAGEGEAQRPKSAHERSPLKIIKALHDRPLTQAVKTIAYLDDLEEKRRDFLRACSPEALDLIAKNGPEYLQQVQSL